MAWGPIRWVIYLGAVVPAFVAGVEAFGSERDPAAPAAGGQTQVAQAEPAPKVARAEPGSLTVCARVAEVPGSLAAVGTAIPGATVILVAPDGSAQAGNTGEDGCVVFVGMGAGPYRVTVTAPGSVPVDGHVDVREGGAARFDAPLAVVAADAQEVVIEAAREAPGETRRTIRPEEVRNIPGAANDALKSVHSMPGVARSPFGVNMLVVRGAAPGDTRVFLDGQEIPQLYHFGGGTSVVATEALSRIDFLPGGFGVRYGRAIGGVVDVETRSGKEEGLGGFFDADFYDASVMAEGGIGRGGEDGQFLAAARRSYVDMILPAVARGQDLNFTVAPRYYDYQLRYDRPTTESGLAARVMAYGSDDAFTFVIDKPNEDGLRGRYLFRTAFHRLQSNISKPLADGWILSLTPAVGYQMLTLDGGGMVALQGNRVLGALRAEMRGKVHPRANLLVGFDGELTRDSYAVDYADDGNSGASAPDRRMIAAASYARSAGALYAEAEIDALGGFTWVPGVRVDAYAPHGKVTVDPRVAARWRFRRSSWAKAYAGLYHQPPQLHEWDSKLGNPNLRPAQAVQVGVGGGHEFESTLRVDGEVFYKWLDDMPVQAAGDPSDPSGFTRWTNEGIGRAYGFEALVRRELGERVSGWVSYTLSRSERASPYTPGWKTFHLDQTHILSTVAAWQMPRGWTLSSRFRYVTGNPVTVVDEAVYDADQDRYLPVPGFRHDERLPSFHQLDVRVDKRWVWSGWTLDAYLDVQNVYARLNPERVRYDFDYSERAYITGLPVFPSIGIRGEF